MILEQINSKSKTTALAPALADVLALIVGILWLEPLSKQLGQPSGLNALILVLLYILFSCGVFLLRKLKMDSFLTGWRPPGFLLDRRVRAVLAFLLGLLMMTTMAYQLGYFASILNVRSAGLDEGSSSALLVYMPGALLGFSMLYILVLAFPVEENVQPGSKRAPIYAFLGPLFVNGLFLFSVAQARVLSEEFNFSSTIFAWAAALIILAISFLPPRVLLQNKYPSRISLLSFTLLLLLASWFAAQ